MTDLPLWKIHNIYQYGSQIYGTSHAESDSDYLVIGSSLYATKEFNNGELNIHLYTPDKFEDSLRAYNMLKMECIFAPMEAIILEQKDYRNSFKIDIQRFKKSILTQSHSSWINGKLKLRETDVYRGLKSIFHSLRILAFADQILANGKIIDFKAATHYWQEIDGCGEMEWEYFKNKYLPEKRKLEEKIISFKNHFNSPVSTKY